jgi:hypothetical protein
MLYQGARRKRLSLTFPNKGCLIVLGAGHAAVRDAEMVFGKGRIRVNNLFSCWEFGTFEHGLVQIWAIAPGIFF